jgi:hypothetical protein
MILDKRAVYVGKRDVQEREKGNDRESYGSQPPQSYHYEISSEEPGALESEIHPHEVHTCQCDICAPPYVVKHSSKNAGFA